MLSLLTSTAFAQGVSQQQSIWRATNDRVFNSATAQFQRSAGASDPVSITVILKLNNEEALHDLTRRQRTPGDSSYRRWLSSAESTQQFAPTVAQAQAVADYLKRNGFTNVQIASNRLLVTADGTAVAAQLAFNTQIGVYRRNNGEVGIANMREIQVPAELSQIDQVLGLDTMIKARVRSLPESDVRPATGTASGFCSPYNAKGYDADEFATVYNRPSDQTGRSTVAALVGWGGMTPSVNDLQQFESARGIAAVPTSILPASNQGSTDYAEQSEWSMDAQAIVGISGGVQQLLFYTSGGANGSGANISALAPIINQAVSDNTAKVVNMSWSISECGGNSWVGYFDSIFALGVSQGQTFAASSGDNGAYPCSAPQNGAYGDTSQPAVVYPASSPYVVALGGTTLTTNANLNYVSESAWPYSGGGISTIEAKPSWQSGFSGAYRQVPDLAFNADWDYSPVIYYKNGTRYCNGGTSLSSPLFVGAWSVLESANNNTLGFAPPLIYPMTSQLYASSTLHDVTAGNNGYYAAKSGYDNATGWGSFDISKMLDSLGPKTYTVTANAGVGGSISPSGVLPANQGDSKTFTITADAGYTIVTWNVSYPPTTFYDPSGTCTGTVISIQKNADGATSSVIYTTDPITASCTVVPTFRRYYMMTPVASLGGTIQPSSPTPTTAGGDLISNLAITAAPGYKLDSVGGTCPGRIASSNPPSYSYYVSGVTADCTIIPNFVPDTPYTITASTDAGGTINPTGSIAVREGESKTFTITANPGYSVIINGFLNIPTASFYQGGTCVGTISNVQWNENAASVGATFTTNSITASCTLTPKIVRTYVATFIPATGGHINAAWIVNGGALGIAPITTAVTTQSLNSQGTGNFSIITDPGYKLESVGGTCPGTIQSNGQTYSISYPTADCTAIPKFVPQ
jgi:hypothetical protein